MLKDVVPYSIDFNLSDLIFKCGSKWLDESFGLGDQERMHKGRSLKQRQDDWLVLSSRTKKELSSGPSLSLVSVCPNHYETCPLLYQRRLFHLQVFPKPS